MKYHHLFGAAVLFATSPTFAQSTDGAALTLAQAMDAAHVGVPVTQKADAAAEEARAHTHEAFATYLPRFTASAQYLTDKKYMFLDIAGFGSIPQVMPTTLGQITGEYLLFDGFAGTNNYRAAKEAEQAAVTEADWTRFQTARDIQMRFFRVIAAQTLKDVAEQNLKVLQDHLRDVTAQKKAGVATNYDLLRVEVQVSEAKSEVMNSLDNVEIARGRLAESLGREDKVEAAGQLPVLSAELVQKVSPQSFADRGDLKALGHRVEAANYLDAASSRYLVPQLSLFGQYQYYNNRNDRFDDYGNFRHAYAVGLNLTWNFFDGGRSIAKSQADAQKKIQVEKGLRIAQLKSAQDLELWKRKYAYSCSVYQSRLSDIEKSKESVRLAREGRRVGARTTTDLLDAETELYRAQAGAVNAQMGAIEALVNVELATGQSLYQF